MRYLLTGAAGFIGFHTVSLLIDAGHQVVGIDSLNAAYDRRLKLWRRDALATKRGFRFVEGDITDPQQMQAVFDTCKTEGFVPDALINLAARAGVPESVADPVTYYGTNLGGLLNLLELCKKYVVKKLVQASTSSVYGNPVLINGEMPQPVKESDSTDRPLSPYAASKKAAETLAHSYHYLFGIDVTIPRYFTVYGPAGRPEMSLFRFVKKISEGDPITVFGDGKQSRDFTYVGDIARGTITGLKPLGYEIINLGSHRPTVLLDAIHMIEEAVGRKATIEYRPLQQADVPTSWADISKAKSLLGWKPEVSLAQGIAYTVEWYRTNRAWAHELVLQ